MLKCTYMMVTFLFVSYNKGDWVRRSFSSKGGWGGRGMGRERRRYREGRE